MVDICINYDMDIRTTIKLTDEQAGILALLSSSLDIDQGKVIRWALSALINIVQNKNYEGLRNDLSPQEKYLLDTLKQSLT